MTAKTISLVALALGLSLGFANAQTATAKCPVPGSVPADQMPADCKSPASATQQPMDKNAAAPRNNSATTDSNQMTTGSTTKPEAGQTTNAGQATAPANALLASDFIGQTVYSPTNDTVGKISDILMDRKLNVIYVVVGVGGFLGIGEKDVAIAIDDIQVAKDGNNKIQLTTNMTKDQLKAKPTFDQTVYR